METKERFLSLTIEEISQAYKGKDHVCRCGCAGTYTSTSFVESPRSDVDDKKVARLLSNAKKLVKSGKASLEVGSNHFNISYGANSAYTFYTDELKS